MVGNNSREEILTSCKATAMIYNDAQKKWLHCAPNGPAKIQLLFSPETQAYRIVGRQIQDHEVVLNHSISKGIKYNQATTTFHQWRDQSCVYGLNFSSKLDAQEFGSTMMKILDSVNGSTNYSSSSQMIINGGATLPPSSMMNNNNTPVYKRQSSQPPSSTESQQQQNSSSPYTSHMRQNSTSIIAITNNFYGQQQSAEDEETNYALISDSCTYYGENAQTKTSTIPPAPPLNLSMSNTSNVPPAPPPPPPPPLPVAPALNSSNNAGTSRKSTNPLSSAPPMDLMSEMAAKFAQRRKLLEENETNNSNVNGNSKVPVKVIPNALPPCSSGAASTSPRVGRKTTESLCTSNDLEKLKSDLLNEIRKDIDKAKQEILNALFDYQQHTKI